MSEDKKVSSRELVREYLESRYSLPLVRMYIKDTDAWVGEETWDGSIKENGDLDPIKAAAGYGAWLIESREGVVQTIADMFSPIRQAAISLIYGEYGISELTTEYIEEFEHGDGYSCWEEYFPTVDGGLDEKALREDIELYAITATEEPISKDN